MTIHPSFFDFPQWPPIPHPLTELRLSNQAGWGLDEWRLYAKVLEMGGEHLLNRLLDTQEKLSIAEEKASRSKKTSVTQTVPEILPGRTLLTSATSYHSSLYKPPKPKPKRGRKPGGEAEKIALLVMEIISEIEATGEHITNKEALLILKGNIGRRNWNYHVDDSSIINAIIKMRKKAEN